MVRITTRDAHGYERVENVPGTISTVVAKLEQAEDGQVYFSSPGRIGTLVRVRQIVALAEIRSVWPAPPTKADFLRTQA